MSIIPRRNAELQPRIGVETISQRLLDAESNYILIVLTQNFRSRSVFMVYSPVM